MAAVPGLENTFNEAAEAYSRWRPGYAPELYGDLFAYRPVDASSHVLEIGIGPGQATRPVLETGCRLTAVEPGDRLASLARENFRDFPRLTVVQGTFQDFEAPDGSYDLIYSASAFHWIPEEEGYRKAFRLLKRGGAFARFAHHPYYRTGQEALFAAIQRVYALYMPDSAPPLEYREEDAERRASLARRYGFTGIAWRLYRQTRSYTAREYAAMAGTHSGHIALGKDRCAALCRGIREAIEAFGGRILVYDTMDLELARKP